MGRKRSKGRNRNVKQLNPSRTRMQKMPDDITAANTAGSAFRRRRIEQNSEGKITTDLMREWYVRADRSGNKSRAQYEREFDSWLAEHDRQVAERAWDEGARWAAVECGAIDDEHQAWIAPGDNPYRAVKGEQK